MSSCLNEHSDIAVFGESLFWGRNFIKPTVHDGCYTREEVTRALFLLKKSCTQFIGEGEGKLKNITKEKWEGIVDGIETKCQTPQKLFLRICLEILKKEGVKYVIEKTPHHVNSIPLIVKAYPNSKFIIMKRSAYGFMLSYKYQGCQKSENIRKRFRSLYHPIACAIVWRRYMLSILEMGERFPLKTHVIEFESLKNNPELCWKGALSFLEIPQSPFIEVQDHNSSFTSRRKSLSPVDVFWMNLIAGKAMRKGGYSIKKSGARVVPILLSILLLVPWASRLFLSHGNSFPGGRMKYFLSILSGQRLYQAQKVNSFS